METTKRLGLMDYISLFLLSFRGFFWRVDGRHATNQRGADFWIKLIIWLIQIYAVFYVITFPFSVFGILINVITFRFSAALSSAIYLFAFLFIVYNPRRLIYNLQFKKSAWWKNTGITPNEVRKDKGLYGEYIATMCAEQNLTEHKIYGKVFNSVIIPKKDGDFNEIDIISVNETGIHVIEAKARTGAFFGSFTGEIWTQKLGAQEYKLQNPIIQNLTHCNYLIEYLYENIPECSLKKKSLVDKIINVVLISLTGFEDHLNRTPSPVMAFFGMAESSMKLKGYQTIDFVGAYGKLLTKEEIDIISQILEKASSYTAAQRQQMMQERAIKQEQKAYSHKYVYYVVRVTAPDIDGTLLTFDTVCKDNGYYKTYLDQRDGLFRAIPEANILGKSKETSNFQEILAYFNSTNKN